MGYFKMFFFLWIWCFKHCFKVLVRGVSKWGDVDRYHLNYFFYCFLTRHVTCGIYHNFYDSSICSPVESIIDLSKTELYFSIWQDTQLNKNIWITSQIDIVWNECFQYCARFLNNIKGQRRCTISRCNDSYLTVN